MTVIPIKYWLDKTLIDIIYESELGARGMLSYICVHRVKFGGVEEGVIPKYSWVGLKIPKFALLMQNFHTHTHHHNNVR
jgi:hypothetical protein